MALTNDTPFDELIQLVITHGTDAMAQAFACLLNHAMLIEREQHIGAESYQRSGGRTAYANGSKPKTLDTPAGRVVVDVPKTRALPGSPTNRSSLRPSPAAPGLAAPSPPPWPRCTSRASAPATSPPLWLNWDWKM